MYEDPNPGRYRVYHVTRTGGSALFEYGVEDGAHVPSEPLKDWRKGFRVNWYGTMDQAEALRTQLNRDRDILGKKVKTEFDVLSKSQKIMYANKARKKRQRTQPKSSVRVVMLRCADCGKVYHGEHHCKGTQDGA